MKLTQLATVKARLGIAAADTTDDTILGNTLDAVSARIANDCNRSFDWADADTFQFRDNEYYLRVPRYPVGAVASWWTKANEVDGWQPLTGTDIPDYLINAAGNVIEVLEPIGFGTGLAKIIYSGGYLIPGTTSNATVPLPSDLEQAAVEQCCYWYQRRAQLGLTSLSGDGGSISQFKSLDLLPSVLAVMSRYERYML